MGWGESKENKEAKKRWRGREEEKETLTDTAERHHVDNGGKWLRLKERVPQKEEDPGITCAACGESILSLVYKKKGGNFYHYGCI